METNKTKKSFLLYCDQSNLLEKLTDKQAGSLIKTVYKYCGNGREDPKIKDPLLDMVFTAFKTALDRDYEKYLSVVERNRINGLKGGRPKKPK